VALVLPATIFLSSWGTARLAHHVPDAWLKRMFGAPLLLVALRFLTAR
jgi:uncharacterized membrane protein YfcA